MSHELTQRANGQIEFAYLKSDGEPWHGLGQSMEEGATNEEWQKAMLDLGLIDSFNSLAIHPSDDYIIKGKMSLMDYKLAANGM